MDAGHPRVATFPERRGRVSAQTQIRQSGKRRAASGAPTLAVKVCRVTHACGQLCDVIAVGRSIELALSKENLIL
jgi:hypothetical protein